MQVDTPGNSLPFLETLDNFNPQTDKQRDALKKLKGLASFAKDYLSGGFPKPVLFALHGKPGTGKTHLIKGFMNELSRAGIDYEYVENPDEINRKFPASNKKIYIIDDLFASNQNVDSFFTFQYGLLERLLFSVYSEKKILVFTSNFSLKDICLGIEKTDKIGRLSSRINEMAGYCPDLELDGVDYRKKVNGDEGVRNVFGKYFG